METPICVDEFDFSCPIEDLSTSHLKPVKQIHPITHTPRKPWFFIGDETTYLGPSMPSNWVFNIRGMGLYYIILTWYFNMLQPSIPCGRFIFRRSFFRIQKAGQTFCHGAAIDISVRACIRFGSVQVYSKDWNGSVRFRVLETGSALEFSRSSSSN